MNIDKQIRQWAQLVNESEDYRINESDDLGTLKENMVWDKNCAANFNLEDENNISILKLIESVIEEHTGYSPLNYGVEYESGTFEISTLKGYPNTFFIQCPEGPESEFWKKIEQFIKKNTTGDYGELKPQELDVSGSGIWAVPITLI